MTDVATIYGKDNLAVLVTITDEENSPAALDLSGATVEAAAQKTAGTGTIFAGTAEIQSPASAGQVLISFAAATFLGAAGAYTCQLRVTKGTDVQTVSEFTFTVNKSLVVTP